MSENTAQSYFSFFVRNMFLPENLELSLNTLRLHRANIAKNIELETKSTGEYKKPTLSILKKRAKAVDYYIKIHKTSY